MRISGAEDDDALWARLRTLLDRRGCLVATAATGEAPHFHASVEAVAAVVLDLGLPLADGLTGLRRRREEGGRVPVRVLTARDTCGDRVEALRIGAARPVLRLGRIEIAPARRPVRDDGVDMPLTPLEFRALFCPGLNAGRVVPQEELLEHVCAGCLCPAGDRDSGPLAGGAAGPGLGAGQRGRPRAHRPADRPDVCPAHAARVRRGADGRRDPRRLVAGPGSRGWASR